MGIVYLNDLMYLLRQINFHDILTQPVMKFVMHLNGTEEDRNAFKERLRSETETGNPSELSSEGASHMTLPKKQTTASHNQEQKNSENDHQDDDAEEDDQAFFFFEPQKNAGSKRGGQSSNQPPHDL